MKRICVFCGSGLGARQAYREAARETGRYLAANGTGVVYGGGHAGLMGEVADAALAAGGEVIGVMPRFMVDRERAHRGLTELRIVDSMHTRKAMMAELSDAFIALPGGFGTLEEFCEVLTWTQLGLQQKPCGLLNVEGYFDGLLAMFEHAAAEGFVRQQHRAIVVTDDSISELVVQMMRPGLPGESSVPDEKAWIQVVPDQARDF